MDCNLLTSTGSATHGDDRLGVVIPLANEAETTHELLSRVSRQIKPDDLIFCVLDNASQDDTRQQVQQAAREDTKVVEVWAPENRCVVDAYFAGYQAALDAGCDWILEMDGGLSHCPEEIPAFLNAIGPDFDYIGGCRFMEGGAHDGGLKRRFLSRGGTVVANLVLGTNLKDMTSGFQCFRRSALQQVVSSGVGSRAHFFQTEIKHLMRHWRCHEVPISYRCPSDSVDAPVIWDAIRNLTRLKMSHRDSSRAA